MNFLTRYVKNNGGSLVLMRKFLGFWMKYEPYDNKLNKSRAKMNGLIAKLEAEHENYRKLLANAKVISDEISTARDCPHSYGTPFTQKLPLFPFRHRAIAAPPDNWKKYSAFMRGKTGTIADKVASDGSFSVVGTGEVDLYSPSGEDQEGVMDTMVVARNSIPVVPRRNNNNQKQKQQNNQQNNPRNN